MHPLFFSCILCIMMGIISRKELKYEYGVWRNMIQRCTNSRVPNYHRYGGRGITVCEQWRSFDTFIQDMGRRPARGYSIERRENDGNYEPGNCYWATREEQENNKARSVKLTYKGKTLTLTQWARELNLDYEKVRARYKYGWSVEDIFEAPSNKYHKPRSHETRSVLITYGDKTQTVTEWATELGVPYEVIRSRHRYGWSPERIIETPVIRRKS